MRFLKPMVAALLATALLALSAPLQNAQAQGMGGGGGMGGVGGMGGGRGRHQADASKAGDKAPKADDKAYKDALKRIPDKKVDPWDTMR